MSRQTDQLRRATDTLNRITTQDVTGALRRLDDWLPGISGGSDGPGPVNAVSDPTGNLAGKPDPASAAIKRIHHAIAQLELHAETLRAEIVAAQPRHPNTRDIEATKYANDPLCANCGDELAVRNTDLGGLLTERRQLGRWCSDFATRNNRLPNVNECVRHHKGQPVRIKA